MIQLYLDGLPAASLFNGFNQDGVKTSQVNLGTYKLSEGEHILSIKIMDTEEATKHGNMACTDCLQFKK